MVWLFLLFLGITLYFIVQQSVVRVTRTPWWQLWLALMIPAFAIAAWTLTHRPLEAMPTALLVGAFIVSVVLYMVLLGANPRPLPPVSQTDTNANAATSTDSTSPLSQAEQAQLQTCFPWSVYYLQQIDLRPQAVICRGQLRKTPEEAYQTIRQNIQAQFGDRFLVLLQSGAMNQPFFALVANPYEDSKKQPFKTLNRPILALSLFLLTLATTTLTGLSLHSPALKPEALSANPSLLLNGLPYALTLMLILGVHELGHYFTAQFYKIRTTLPYFIPIPFAFGTFGAYIQMRSPIPNRKALFDVGIAGPVMGLAITLPLLIWGLDHSTLATLSPKSPGLSPDALNPRSSLLFSLLCRLTFGSSLTGTVGVDLHPVAIAGWLGLIVTALNLMPFGQLDGGHLVHAMFGQRMGMVIGQVSRIMVLLMSFVHPFLQPILLLWGILLLFMPATDEPALNDVTDLDNYRDSFGLLALGILLLIILPVPNGLEPWFFAANPMP